MKITVLQENLLPILKEVSSFAPSSPQLPILENILIEAKKSELLITATNLSIGIRRSARAKVDEEGNVCVRAKNIVSFVSLLKAGKTEIEAKGGKLIVTNGKTKAEFNTQNGEEYPRLEEHNKKRKIEAREIREIARKVGYAAARDETRAVLTGIKIERKAGGERAVATDGFRLSIKEIKNSILGKEGQDANIPARLFSEINKLSNKEKNIFFEIDKKGKKIIASWNGTLINAQLIEGEFPDFEKIVPEDFNTRVTTDKEDIERAIKTAAVFAIESSNIIRLSIRKDSVLVTANSPQAGKGKSEAPSKVEGEEKNIAFNYKFLLDFLKSIDGREIIFEMTDPLKPGVFKAKNDPSYLHIIMPVRVQN